MIYSQEHAARNDIVYFVIRYLETGHDAFVSLAAICAEDTDNVEFYAFLIRWFGL